MAEHLFGELSASQQREAQLAAEVEQLRALQAELAEAAAAEAESCRSDVQVGDDSYMMSSPVTHWVLRITSLAWLVQWSWPCSSCS